MEDLYNVYRPKDFDTLVGQDHIIRSLESFDELPQKFLLSGPSGVGKSTVARIIASKVGCTEEPYLMIINGSNNRGIDDMRANIEFLRYSGNPNKFLIIEEAHEITKIAWDCFLEPLEHLPGHAYVALVTTNVHKIPKTIAGRCKPYQFKELNHEDIMSVLIVIDELEEIGLHEHLDVIADKALGSMRAAIVYLDICRGCKTKREIRELLNEVIEEEPMYQLFDLITRKGSWAEAVQVLDKLKGVNPESVRIVIVHLLTKELEKQRDKSKAISLLQILEKFVDSYDGPTAYAGLCLSVGAALLI